MATTSSTTECQQKARIPKSLSIKLTERLVKTQIDNWFKENKKRRAKTGFGGCRLEINVLPFFFLNRGTEIVAQEQQGKKIV